MHVTGIVVTKGNLSHAQLDEVTTPIARACDSVVVWDNSKRLDLMLLSAYVAGFAAVDLIYYQDDDVVTDPAAIIAQWKPGRIVCNMPPEFQEAYKDKPDVLMGFGSVFEQSLIPPTWLRYLGKFPVDYVTKREANRIFTGLNRGIVDMVDVPKRNMPYASDPDRLWRQPDHGHTAGAACARIRELLNES